MYMFILVLDPYKILQGNFQIICQLSAKLYGKTINAIDGIGNRETFSIKLMITKVFDQAAYKQSS